MIKLHVCHQCGDNISFRWTDCVCVRSVMTLSHFDYHIVCVCVRTVNGLCHMVLKTLREIKPYEEITYDYNFDSFNMEAQVSEHRCYRKKATQSTKYWRIIITYLCGMIWGFWWLFTYGYAASMCVCASALALFHIFKPGVLFAVKNYKIALLFNSTKPASQ